MDVTDIAMRSLAAVVVGAMVGINRLIHEKPAGVRTYALVALGAAALVIAADELGTTPDHRADAISRVIQGLVAGIGFLGAGVILRDPRRGRVEGLTTAAAIWVTALFGTACGIGAFRTVGVGVALMFIVLTTGARIEAIAARLFGRPSDPDEK
jgi:putative Mg2+ transporter-C (MgtC) family protein